MKQIYIEGYFKKYRVASTCNFLASHPQRKTIEKRVRIINFFDEFGEGATKKAFGIGRSTVFLWKKKVNDAGGKLVALAPKSKAPINRRKRVTSQKLIDFIKDYRIIHPCVGKETVKCALDAFCKKESIASISESTVGRVINDLKKANLIPEACSKLTLYGYSGKLKPRAVRVKRKKLRKKGYKPKLPGDLVEVDSITILKDKLNRYFFTAIDITTDFAFAYGYKSLTSANGADFLKKFKEVTPFEIKRIQTDNGGEFEKCFRDYVEKQELIHYHNYPRRPQCNPHIERFNRTIQEQYIRWHLDEVEDIEEFNKGLMEYLVWYNTEKPHRSLNKEPPLKYYLDNFILKPRESNMLRTLTYS